MEVQVSTNLELNPITEAALTWAAAGCSVIPVRADKTKKPLIDTWREYTGAPAARDRVAAWFTSMPTAAVAVICGKASGNLEMLELEGRATTSWHLDKIMDACIRRGVDHLFESLLQDGYAEWTPSGGLHMLYRINDHPVPGNQKVARRPATEQELYEEHLAKGTPIDQLNKIKVLSETRGEGGYVVVAPSAGHVYGPNDSWSTCAGRIGDIPTTISWAAREALIGAIHEALDEMPEPVAPTPRPSPASLLSARTDRPGDDFNNRAQWHDILYPQGWQVHHTSGHTTYWTRPGKETRDGYSATTGRAADGDRLYVFTSSTEFEPETPYNKFAAYALLEHHGDFAAAARALGKLGYGNPGPSNDPRMDPAASMGTLRHPDPAPPAAQVPATRDTSAGQLVPKATNTQIATTPVNPGWPVPRYPANMFDIGAGELDLLHVARGYAHIHEDLFKWAGDTNKWWYFTGKVWKRDHADRHNDAGVRFIEAMRDQAQAAGNEGQMKFARKLANNQTLKLGHQARSDHRIATTSDQFDSQGNCVAVDNGTYCLDTHSFTPTHDPKQLITKMLPVAYDKDATAPRWNKFLQDVLPDDEMRRFVQKAIGFTLHGSARERALFLLHGLSGTGKSQFIRAMELLFADHAETASAQTFSAASKSATITNDLNDLRGKRFVALSELDQDQTLNESLIKRLTGGDTAKSRGLYQENSQWRVTFTLWMATNHLPRLSSDDNAVWRRVKPIVFPVVQEDTEHGEIKSIAEAIFNDEAAGILNWALDGVRMYQDEGLGDPPQLVAAVAAYRRDVDTVAQFTEEAIEDNSLTCGEGAGITVRILHGMYSSWCQRNNIRALGERRFNARMESLGYARKKTAVGFTWQGIGTGGNGMLGTMSMSWRQ